MMRRRPVEIVVLYPSLFGIYGDGGNTTVLQKRLEWHGFSSTTTIVELGVDLPDTGEIFLLGGGEDAGQTQAAQALLADGGLSRAVDRGAATLAVNGGYQILGKTFAVSKGDDETAGLALLDITTTPGQNRAVGEMVFRWAPQGSDGKPLDLGEADSMVTGFENHGGQTLLGPGARPLGSIEVGVGNGFGGTEGAQDRTIIGTYAHGPVLARNPALADHLISMATGVELAPLVRPEIAELRRQRFDAAFKGRRTSAR